MKRLVAAVVALAAVVMMAAPASAGPIVDQAVSALRTDPFYVAPGATMGVEQSQAVKLRQQIRAAGTPIYIAILPASAANETGGNPDSLPAAIGQQLGNVTVATVAGNKFRAGSSVLPKGRAASLATTAFNTKHSAGLNSVLSEFVVLVRENVAPAQSGTAAPQAAPKHESSGFPWWAWVLVVLAASLIVGLVLVIVVSRRHAREAKDRADRYAFSDMTGRRTTEEVPTVKDGTVYQAEPKKGETDSGKDDRVDASTAGARWYPGGYAQGSFYGPGYYNDGFLNNLLWFELITGGFDHNRDDYDHDDHDRDDGGNHGGGDDFVPAAQPASDGGDWSSSEDSGTSGGGGDFGGYSDPSPSYDPPDSGGGGDWGGGDSGGGFDSGGGGGFDSGGGGF